MTPSTIPTVKLNNDVEIPQLAPSTRASPTSVSTIWISI